MTPPTSTSEVPLIHDRPVHDEREEPAPGFHLYSFLIGVLTTTCLLGASLWLSRRPEPPAITLHPPPTTAPTATALPTATPAPFTVFVSGAVVEPGLYIVEATSRVGDAIRSAGGLTEDADPALVNQAELLWDGAQVHIPATTAIDPAVDNTLLAAQPPSGVSGAGIALPAMQSDSSGSGKIDINTAGASELESLSGIGPSKAEAIIANRPYSTVDDLERVPGIGPKTVNQLRDQVTVGR